MTDRDVCGYLIPVLPRNMPPWCREIQRNRRRGSRRPLTQRQRQVLRTLRRRTLARRGR